LLSRRSWLAVNATWFAGGETRVEEGIPREVVLKQALFSPMQR
jgi:hypothetical protein